MRKNFYIVKTKQKERKKSSTNLAILAMTTKAYVQRKNNSKNFNISPAQITMEPPSFKKCPTPDIPNESILQNCQSHYSKRQQSPGSKIFFIFIVTLTVQLESAKAYYNDYVRMYTCTCTIYSICTLYIQYIIHILLYSNNGRRVCLAVYTM